jgi:phosphatidate cytidylyltransferase
MFRNRLLSSVVLIPVVLGLTYLGGIWFLGLVLFVLLLAGLEYAELLKRNGGGPSPVFVVIVTWLFVLDINFPQTKWFRFALTVALLSVLVWALVRFERGQSDSVVGWAWTLAGSLYLGWMGAHFVLLRYVGLAPGKTWLSLGQGEGLWWTALALSSTWLADTGAYFAGRAWGRQKLSPLASPSKTWAGFVGGVVLGTLGGAGVAILLRLIAGATGQHTVMTIWDGLALGVLVSLLSPLGDLGESMIKRYAGAKDSGQLIPGHGGMFDRIDSLLWAAVIGFYYAVWIARLG